MPFNRLMLLKSPPIGLIALLVVCVCLSGCGQTNKASFVKKFGAPISVPEEIKATKTMLEPGLLANAARPNPFISLIVPKKKEEAPDPKDVPPAKPVENPFQGYSINGIIYRGKNSIVILSAPDGKSRIMHQGDIFVQKSATDATAETEIQVAKVDKSQVLLKVISGQEALPPEFLSTTLKMGSLVGFKGKSSKGGAARKLPSSPDGGTASADQATPDAIKALADGNKSNLPKSGPRTVPSSPNDGPGDLTPAGGKATTPNLASPGTGGSKKS